MFVATSEFSLGQSLLSVKDIAKVVSDHSLDKVVVADTMNLSALIPLAELVGEKLIMGVRFTLVDEAEQERAPTYQPKVYPRNLAGLRTIYKYLTMSFERPNFYMEPRLSFADFNKMLDEAGTDLLVSTGDFNSIFFHPKCSFIVDEWVARAEVIVDVCPLVSPLWDKLNFAALTVAAKRKLKANTYIPAIYSREEVDLFPIHYSIHKNVEFNFLKPYVKNYTYISDEGVVKHEAAMMQRIEKRFGKIFAIDSYEFNPANFYKWEKAKPLLPSLSSDPAGTLKKLAIAGFKKRLMNPLYGYMPSEEELKTVYIERFKYEMKILDELGFADYILLVYELINWCRGQDIKVGPGRGSVGGSLIAFCLGITDVDPVRFGLLFERFINPTRLDLPDIDLDFQTTRRGEIIEHLYDRYGRENVAGIINYASLQASSALRSTCRILGLPADEYACSKLVPKNFGFSLSLEEAAEQVIDIKNFSKQYPDHWGKACKLEKKLRNFSTHAAGVIVSSRPLTNDAVVEIRSDNRIINWDKKVCEKQGLIKLDILGLTTLDIIDLCLQYVKKSHGVDIDLSAVPLDDRLTLDQFANGNTGGVFQFEGGSVKKLLKGLARGGEITFDDLVAANALNRPGPIEAGLVQAYIDGKNGHLHEAFHPSIEHIVEPTFNVICYQEQIMAVSVAFAGYTLPEADNLRKIMGKKKPEEMAKESEKFIQGAFNTNGIDRSSAQALFDQISKFAFYAFNKSHSVEYSLLGYFCMWLKTHYPVEFYAASLTYIDDKKVRSIIMEANKVGINVDPPSINHSTDKFVPAGHNRIVAPLSKIKFVQGAAKHIMEVREQIGGRFLCKEHLEALTVKRLVNSRVMGAMEAVGALDDLPFIPSAFDPVERSKAINEYMPSLPLGFVQIDRETELDTATKQELVELYKELKEEDESFVLPYIGASPKFMVVFDSAAQAEAKAGKFTESKGFMTCAVALAKADMTRADGYWTGLVKRQKLKKEKTFSNDVLDASFQILKREIDLVKPTVIVCLGSAVSRMFVPTLKGGAADNAGQVHYNKELDANIVLGFAPGMCFFTPELSEKMEEVFEIVGSMVL